MAFNALVSPRTWATDGAGFCLRYAQSWFGAPAMHRSARHAWNATARKHAPSEALPDVPVLLWFDHWGAYNDGLGSYDGLPVGAVGNWGHVVGYEPGVGFYSSPRSGWGSEVFDSISAVERAFNASYIGWSEDINGLRFAEPTKSVVRGAPQEDDDMPDSMYAMVDGVPSWCWINWASGRVFAVHTQKDADWVGSYMGSVRMNFGNDKLAGEKYKSKLALVGILAPKVEAVGLTKADEKRLYDLVHAGVTAAISEAA